MKWSLAMIVRDEQEVLGRVLGDAQAFCDELVVVDTGSTDETKAVALDHGAKVYDYTWRDNFATARNFSFVRCSHEWVVWLDADDRVPPEAQEGFLALKDHLAQPSAMRARSAAVAYRTNYEADDPDVVAASTMRTRVAHRGIRWMGELHERLAVDPRREIRWPDAWVEHRSIEGHDQKSSERNLRILRSGIAASGNRSARNLLALAQELRHVAQFDKALDFYRQAAEAPGSDGPLIRYESFYWGAVCAYALERRGTAFDLALLSAECEPQRAEPLELLAAIHYDRGEISKAIELFEQSCSLTPPQAGTVQPGAYTWRPRENLAQCYADSGRYEDAVRMVDEALPMSPRRALLEERRQEYVDAALKNRTAE